MAACKVGSSSSIVALLALAVVVVLAPAASCRPVVAATSGGDGGEADQCAHRCVREMVACEASSGCASTMMRRSEEQRSGPCGGGCHNEYLGCIDVC
ncbi:hypothetical protein ACP70R_036151 [Stipagrostis hirtigluma subsp. patula]